MATTTTKTNKPILPRGADNRPVDSYNRAKLFSGKALSFDGVNDVVNLNSGIDFTGDFSFCIYFDTPVPIVRGIISDGANVDSIGTLVTTNKSLRFRLDSVNYDFGIDSVYTDGLNFWSFVRSGSTLYVYKNGLQVGSQSVATNTFTLSMLGAQGVGVNYFIGELSNLKAFNTALTAAQVADLYNNPEKVVPTGVDNTALKLWLPMQEGAGTTAYDGSGNGNHGAVSGASWLHGIGAPVSQTAVIDWNKGTNKINDSEFTASSTGAPNFFRGFTRNSTTEESPFGTFDAVKMTENNTNSNPALVFQTTGSSSNPHTIKAYIKADAATSIAFATNGATNPGNINVTTEWQAFEVTQSGANDNPHIGGFATITQGSGIVLYVWHPQLQEASSAGPYVGTIGTAQTSPVLLPQGLTTGRDITGVNLFENVRKQGALNLDGNSWAEVHDNESIDLSDANASFEAWVYHIDKGSTSQYIMNKFDGTTGVRVRTETGNNFGFYASDGTNNIADSGTFALTANAWNHVVLTTDGTNFKRYINGALVDTDVAGTALTTFANADSLYIGSEQTNASLTESRIAQPRIYNRALTAAEVLRNYNSGKNTYTNN